MKKTVEIVSIFSEAMQKDIPAVVITPVRYELDNTLRFPVLYLLHGYSGDFMGYHDFMPDLQKLSDETEIIFVCPDGGFNSWYLDSPYGRDCLYETFIAKELIQYIDNQYPTKKKRAARAIAGLSMGGHGALYNALRNPTVFGAAGSMSGGLDFTPFPFEWDISHRLGTYLLNKKRWEEHCVCNMIDLIPKDFPLIIDCGVDDFFINVNRQFHEKLLKAKIPHDYTERQGEHNWEYWANATRFQILFFKHFFEQ